MVDMSEFDSVLILAPFLLVLIEDAQFLQLFVKVDKDWRSSQTRLRHYGYDLN